VQGDDLMAKDVIAGRDVGGDGGDPGVVVGDQGVGGPGAGGVGIVE